jgi:hypothetical protein
MDAAQAQEGLFLELAEDDYARYCPIHEKKKRDVEAAIHTRRLNPSILPPRAQLMGRAFMEFIQRILPTEGTITG